MTIKIVVSDEKVQLSQGLGHTMTIPLAYVPELAEALRKTQEGESNYFYQTNGVAFAARSCKLILFNNGLSPHVVATFKPSTVPKLIEGLLSYVDACYL